MNDLFLEECETIKNCLLWANQQFPNFWRFATCQKLTEQEITNLKESICHKNDLFRDFMSQFKFAVQLDRSEEARNLLILSANSMKILKANQAEAAQQNVTKKYR